MWWRRPLIPTPEGQRQRQVMSLNLRHSGPQNYIDRYCLKEKIKEKKERKGKRRRERNRKGGEGGRKENSS